MAAGFLDGGLLCLNLVEQFSSSSVISNGPSLRIQTDHRLVEIVPDQISVRPTISQAPLAGARVGDMPFADGEGSVCQSALPETPMRPVR